jgi:hypothetical protein
MRMTAATSSAMSWGSNVGQRERGRETGYGSRSLKLVLAQAAQKVRLQGGTLQMGLFQQPAMDSMARVGVLLGSTHRGIL